MSLNSILIWIWYANLCKQIHENGLIWCSFLNAFLSLFSERMAKMGWNFTQTPPTFSSFGGKRCSKIRREWCTIEAKRYCSEMRCIYLKRCHFFILKSSWNLKRGVYFTILDILSTIRFKISPKTFSAHFWTNWRPKSWKLLRLFFEKFFFR